MVDSIASFIRIANHVVLEIVDSIFCFPHILAFA